MKMKPSPPVQDYFAEIATQKAGPIRPGLRAAPRVICPKKTLPWKMGPIDSPRPLAPKIKTAEDLEKSLVQAREEYAPFLEDHAPRMVSLRARQEIKRFDWRVESDADRLAFGSLLEGKGGWQEVRLPHFGPPLGKATTLYRTEFELESSVTSQEDVVLRFGGVDYSCQVYLNGICLGSHEGFFEEFEFSCRDALRPGKNVLLVRVENDFTMLGSQKDGQAINGDKIYAATGLGYNEPELGWHHCPAGMGIWNRVFFEGRSRLQITDLWVRPMPEEEAAEIRIEVTQRGRRLPEGAIFQVSVFGQNFPATVLEKQRYQPSARTLRGFGDLDGDHQAEIPSEMESGVNFFTLRIPMPKARIWDLKSPWLYQVQVELIDANGKALDSLARSFGMRTFRQDEESKPKGKFYLNGREIRLRGANTMGHLERCVMEGNLNQLRDDILLAKLTHMNFLRLTQRPVHREVYEMCDRLGLLLQTDMPMFATVRRNQMLEVVRQCSRMERHVRAHPSNILVSFINEPRPAAAAKPHRFLLRKELERMFSMGSEAVLQENPDRVIKCVDGDYDPPSPYGMPDNHCYCGWYIGHGIDLGALHAGGWLPVKPGWHFGCGEFGAEGLDSHGVMKKYYPRDWQPPSLKSAWTPQILAESQSWNFHFLWYDTPKDAGGWIDASQRHQEWITRLMTEAYRRHSWMNTFAIHLFIDAWPCGWMKAIMDVDRVPKKAWFAYRDALSPTAVSLRCDRTQAWAGEVVPVELWVAHDSAEKLTGASWVYEMKVNGKGVAHGKAPAKVPACSSLGQGILPLRMPEVEKESIVQLGATLLDLSGKPIHDQTLELRVFPRLGLGEVAPWAPGGSAAQNGWLSLLGAKATVRRKDRQAPVVIPNWAAYLENQAEIDSAVKDGAVALFLTLPPGSYRMGQQEITVRVAGMGPRHFASGTTSHPWVEGFGSEDFKFWHSASLGHVAPILSTVLEGKGWNTVLRSGDGGWKRPWDYVPVVVETSEGKGRWVVCQVELSSTVGTNPTAARFAQNLIAGKNLLLSHE